MRPWQGLAYDLGQATRGARFLGHSHRQFMLAIHPAGCHEHPGSRPSDLPKNFLRKLLGSLATALCVLAPALPTAASNQYLQISDDSTVTAIGSSEDLAIQLANLETNAPDPGSMISGAVLGRPGVPNGLVRTRTMSLAWQS